MLNFERVGTMMLAAAFLAVLPVNSYAQKTTWLTDENIRVFMKDSETVYTKPYDEYLAFMRKTTHEDYRGKIIATINTGNDAPVQMPINLDKQTLLSQARDGYDSIRNGKVTQTIHNITISPDKKSATVKSNTVILNQTLEGSDSMQSTLADSDATCTDELVYTPMTGIQLLKSDCTSVMTVKQEQEL